MPDLIHLQETFPPAGTDAWSDCGDRKGNKKPVLHKRIEVLSFFHLTK